MSRTLKAGPTSHVTLCMLAARFGVALDTSVITAQEGFVVPEDGAVVGATVVTNGTVSNDSVVNLYNVTAGEVVPGITMTMDTDTDGNVVTELTPTVTSGYNVSKGDILAITSTNDASADIDEPIFMDVAFSSSQLTPQYDDAA